MFRITGVERERGQPVGRRFQRRYAERTGDGIGERRPRMQIVGGQAGRDLERRQLAGFQAAQVGRNPNPLRRPGQTRRKQ